MIIKAGLNFTELFKLVGDVMSALPQLEAAVKDAQAIMLEVEAGQMPTPEQIAVLKTVFMDIQKIVTDAKAAFA